MWCSRCIETAVRTHKTCISEPSAQFGTTVRATAGTPYVARSSSSLWYGPIYLMAYGDILLCVRRRRVDRNRTARRSHVIIYTRVYYRTAAGDNTRAPFLAVRRVTAAAASAAGRNTI